jgi:hypothetical protein
METSASILLTLDGNPRQLADETGRPGRHAVEMVHLPRRRARRDFNEVGAGRDLDGPFYGAVSYVDRGFKKKPTDEAALRKIADLFPPSCIFDEHGSVLCDSGAMQHIDAIALEPAKDNQGCPARGSPRRSQSSATGPNLTLRCFRSLTHAARPSPLNASGSSTGYLRWSTAAGSLSEARTSEAHAGTVLRSDDLGGGVRLAVGNSAACDSAKVFGSASM